MTLSHILLKDLTNKINDGKNLNEILGLYNGEFTNDIIRHYYHINNGPDLRDFQEDALKEALTFFEKYPENFNYNLLWCCGLGKTKMSLTISKRLNVKTILIGVPSLVLMDQFSDELKLFFTNTEIFKLYSKQDLNDINDKRIYTRGDLQQFLLGENRYKIIISTYHSSKFLLEITESMDIKFDLVILDEVHHLLDKKQKVFNNILKIN